MARVPRRSAAAALLLVLMWAPVAASAGEGQQGGGVAGAQPASPPPPTKTKHVPPVYPASAQAARVRGAVVVEAIIGATGKVEDVRVVQSIPLLDLAAMDAVKQWEFTPTSRNGVAVPVLMTVTVEFTLDDRLPPLQQMTPEVRPRVLAELAKQRALWITRRPAAYYLKLTLANVPTEPFAISSVRDGKAVAGGATVEHVFDRLVDSVGTEGFVAIVFDPELGFPAEFQTVATAPPGDDVRVRVEVTPIVP